MIGLDSSVIKYLERNGLKRIPFHGADYSYGFRENEPVFSFILDPGDGSLLNRVMSLYWATAEFISRPWCLFIFPGSALPYNQSMIANLSEQYNIKSVENPETDDLINKIDFQLKELSAILYRYLELDSSRGLGEIIDGWREEKTILEDTFEVKVIEQDLTPFRTAGQLIPNRTTIPLIVKASNFDMEGILPRLIQNSIFPIFSTEHRNLPSVFEFELSPNPTFLTRFEADKGNIIEATSFEALITEFKSDGKIFFEEPNTGKVVFAFKRV